MASIIERKDAKGKVTFFVRIRRRGFPPAVGTFTRKTDAQRWIYETETAIVGGVTLNALKGGNTPSRRQ